MMLSCISGSADFLRLRGEQPAEVGVSADTASDAKRSACRRVFLSDKHGRGACRMTVLPKHPSVHSTRYESDPSFVRRKEE